MSVLQAPVYENVTIIPKFGGYYWPTAAYSNGKLVPASLSGFFCACPPEIDSQTVLEKEVIYGGSFQQSFGHFFIETLDRLWFARENPHLPILFPQNFTITPWMQEIFNILKIKNEMMPCTLPTKVLKCHFPVPLMLAYNFFTKEYLDFLNILETPSPIKGKKIFISRGKNINGYMNNAEIEEYALKNGYTLLEPESVSMEKRLYELGTAEEILAVEASSLCSLALIKNLKAKVFVIPRQMDALIAQINPAFHYLNIDNKIPIGTHGGVSANMLLNIASLDFALNNQLYIQLHQYEDTRNIPQALSNIYRQNEIFDNLAKSAFSLRTQEKKLFFSCAIESYINFYKSKDRKQISTYYIQEQFLNCLLPFFLKKENVLGIEHFFSLYNDFSVFSKMPDLPRVITRLLQMLQFAKNIVDTSKMISFSNNFINSIQNLASKEILLQAKLLLLELYDKINDMDNFDLLFDKICQEKEGLQSLAPGAFLHQTCAILRKQEKRDILLNFLEENQQTRMPWASMWYQQLSIEYAFINNEDRSLFYAYQAHFFDNTNDVYKAFLLDTLISYNKLAEASNFLQLLSWNGNNSEHYHNMRARFETAKKTKKQAKLLIKDEAIKKELITIKNKLQETEKHIVIIQKRFDSLKANVHLSYLNFTYLRYRIATEITRGKTKQRYKAKKRALKELISFLIQEKEKQRTERKNAHDRNIQEENILASIIPDILKAYSIPQYLKFTYFRYRIASEITFGKTKKRYKMKKREVKQILVKANIFMK